MATKWAFRSPTDYGFNQTNTAKERWSSSTGTWSSVFEFKGPADQLAAFIAGLINPSDIDIDRDGDLVTVTVTWPSASSSGDPTTITQPDPIFDAWSLTGNYHEIPLLNHPDIAGNGFSISGIGDNLLGQVLAQVKRYKAALENDESVPGIETYALLITDATVDQIYVALARLLFASLVKGDETMEVVQPVLRHVKRVTSASEVQASMTDVGRAHTWEQLKLIEPNLDEAAIIGVDTIEDWNTASDYVWEKRCPTIEIEADGKRQLIQEYWAWEAWKPWVGGYVRGDDSTKTLTTYGGLVLTINW